MKKLKLLSACSIALAMFFSSCGGGDEKTETANTDSTTNVTKSDSSAPSDIATTPQTLSLYGRR